MALVDTIFPYLEKETKTQRERERESEEYQQITLHIFLRFSSTICYLSRKTKTKRREELAGDPFGVCIVAPRAGPMAFKGRELLWMLYQSTGYVLNV